MRSSIRLFLVLLIVACALLHASLSEPALSATPTPPATPSAASPAVSPAPPHERPSATLTSPAPPAHRPMPTPSLPWSTPWPTPSSAGGDDSAILGADRLTLETCLAWARDNHPTLRAAQARYEQAIARVHQSQALYVPTVNATVSRTHTYTQDGGIPPGSIPQYAGFNPQVTSILLQPTASFSWYINDGGKRRLSVQRDLIDLLTWVLDWRTQWRKLALTIEQDYVSVVYNRGLLMVAQDSLNMASATLRQAEGLFRAGKKTRLDVLQAETDMLGARSQLYQQIGNLNKAWAALEADVGIPLNPYTRLDRVLDETLDMPAREKVMELAFKQRSDVQSYANQIAVKKAQIEVNKTQLKPTLQTLLNYGYTGQDFPALTTWSGQLALAIPLSAGPGVKAQNEEVLGAIKELLENSLALRLQIFGDVNKYYVALREAEQRVEMTRQQMEHAQQSYKLAFKRYRGGISEFIEVTNARTVLNNARTSFVNARNDRKNAELQLFAAMEERLPPPPVNTPRVPIPGAPPEPHDEPRKDAPSGMPATPSPGPAVDTPGSAPSGGPSPTPAESPAERKVP